MNYQAKQEELDIKKWLESERKGADTCGEYEYCACCDKNAEYPCAAAAEKSAKAVKPATAKTAPKTSTAKSATKTATAKPAASKTATAKTTAAKSATAKTTAKK